MTRDLQVGDIVRPSEEGKRYYGQSGAVRASRDPRGRFERARIIKLRAMINGPTVVQLEYDADTKGRLNEDRVRLDCIELVPEPPPKFASVEEADAWMAAQSQGTLH